jgi:hypothetical protein
MTRRERSQPRGVLTSMLTLKQMKADASEAEARLQKVKQAGSESWTVFGAALAESPKAFDRANQAAWDALKRAAPPPT